MTHLAVLSLVPFGGAIIGVLLAFATVVRPRPSPAAWLFFFGMLLLATETLCTGLSLHTDELMNIVRWLKLAFIIGSVAPAVWLAFGLSYSRGDSRESLARWRIPLCIAGVLPIGLSAAFPEQLLQLVPAGAGSDALQLRFGPAAQAINLTALVTLVLILTTLEQTLRSAVGTMRWRIKLVVVGLAVIFGGRLYVRTQAVLFGSYAMSWSTVESSALLIGGCLLAAAYARSRFAEVDVYPSRAVLRSSITVLIAGGYLFIVGVLAQIAKRLGGADAFQLQAFVVLVGISGLAVLLLSDRLRQRIHRFVGRHFTKAQHDSVQIWAECSRRLADVKDEAGLCRVSTRLMTEFFEVLSASLWLFDGQKAHLGLAASTARQTGDGDGTPSPSIEVPFMGGLGGRVSPFRLDGLREPWASELRRLNPRSFPNGGERWCVPLSAHDGCLGVLVLADRVDAAPYTAEELELMQCMSDQMTSALLNLRLAHEVARSRELEAFRTMSAFFVHDLKNAAASFNLMLKNLRVHFDDPAFREDALRTVANTASRIDETISRLGALRQRPDFTPVRSDLNQIVAETLDRLNDTPPRVTVTREFQPLPSALADREQIGSVVTNLILNARDAVGAGGSIHVRTERCGNAIVLSVTDSGCGMSPAFVRERLFRPFQTTKKKGLGIGMFQSRAIIEAHGGTIGVESEAGKGTTFRVTLPVWKRR